MIKTFFGKKIEQSQRFTQSGDRIPVTIIKAGSCPVVSYKKEDKEGYNALCLGIGAKKNLKKPLQGVLKKAGVKQSLGFLKEIKVDKEDLDKFKIGEEIKLNDVFKIGDKINVTSISKGKGFAGVVKRHHFKGGPKTHGQSDRERAPGSIGQTTTPGRVYKGKRMAGHMGVEQVTIRNLEVVEVNPEKKLLIIKGLVPGGKNSLLTINKIG